MDEEHLPLVHRDGAGNGASNGDSLQEQLSSYHKRQRERQQRRERTRHIGRATLGFLAAALVTLLLVALSWPSHHPSARAVELETLMNLYRHAKNFSGVVRLSHNGQKTFQEAMGRANVPLSDAMKEHSVFPMGSHAQLFTSVALYQLQEQGVVELSKPVNSYLTSSDLKAFGAINQTQWCPTLADKTECEQLTFEQLLYMGSGLVDLDPHRKRSLTTLGDLGEQVGAFINEPLAFKPGSNYSYSDANYVLLAYMVEKMSGESYREYVKKHICHPVGMKDTSYDPYNGVLGIQHGLVDQYVQYYAHREPNDSTSASGSGSNAAEETHMHHMTTGTCQAYQDMGNGVHGLQSTGKDMHKLYTDLFHKHGRHSKLLSADSIEKIVHLRNPTYPSFAQGIGVDFEEEEDTEALAQDDIAGNWPAKIAFCGSTACSTTCMAMQMPSANQSIVASAFTNDVRLLFPSEEAFHNYKPREFLEKREPVTATDGFEKSDGGVNILAWNLLQVFLRFYTAPDN
ncbi:hypothetical protein BBJ28_00001880 [Nothophytophthora sp. Chile5]|nr:hypothetical protein BBJ28_00001880 [Nothophytophthora sp. Chile5]